MPFEFLLERSVNQWVKVVAEELVDVVEDPH